MRAGAKDVAKDVAVCAKEERPLRPAQCRAYMRKTLAREFRGIVDGFVKSAKKGSCHHVKLATELLETKSQKQPMPSGGRTLGRLMTKLEQLED